MQKSLFFTSPAPNPIPPKSQFKSLPQAPQPNPIPPKSHFNSLNKNPHQENDKTSLIPTMPEIMAASRAQNLSLQLQKLGPFFQISAWSLETEQELGRAEGLVRFWFGGRILHLDSIRMRRETLGMQKSIFGLGLFVGAVAVRHGYDCGCRKAELLAINDTDLFHSKFWQLALGSHSLLGSTQELGSRPCMKLPVRRWVTWLTCWYGEGRELEWMLILKSFS
ncbi:uncharacterized protein LOC131229168 isoform X2 [Magnolia sinica]|uniref:uncharacterized protein LOC131229168 isoform X2 n=1 Tax=Magnolia sinica TaxID=86752 RepID=UPI00265B13DB|nr:uncharacterized protein LOC131229168 isoform X2 [Magnolia sinica]XP_058081040.1 uncharacterized protein LOC131229168 isoform X2 [Magnolia sinica]